MPLAVVIICLLLALSLLFAFLIILSCPLLPTPHMNPPPPPTQLKFQLTSVLYLQLVCVYLLAFPLFDSDCTYTVWLRRTIDDPLIPHYGLPVFHLKYHIYISLGNLPPDVHHPCLNHV